MRKRILSAAAVLAAAGVLLFGCSMEPSGTAKEDSGEPEKTKLQIAVFEGGYGRQYWDKVCEAFEEEYPEIEVVMQSNAEIGDIIRPTIIAGNPPDFVYLPSNNISGVTAALIKDHALADITDVMEEVEDRMLPGFLQKPARTSALYWRPWSGRSRLLKGIRMPRSRP